MANQKYIFKPLLTLLSVFFLLTLTACSGTTEEKAERCLEVPSSIKANLQEGINTEEVTISKLKAVKSDDYKSAYFVSVELDGPGLEDEGDIATLTTNRLEETGIYMAVDSVAKEFFVFPDASETDAEITMVDDGADESRSCLE